MFSSRRGRMRVALVLMAVGAVVCLAALVVSLMSGGPTQDIVVAAGGLVCAAAAAGQWRRDMVRDNRTKVPPVVGTTAFLLGASVLGREATAHGGGGWVDWLLVVVAVVMCVVAIVLVVTDIRDDPERGRDEPGKHP